MTELLKLAQALYPKMTFFIGYSTDSPAYVLYVSAPKAGASVEVPFYCSQQQFIQELEKAVAKVEVDASSLGRFLRGV